MKSKRVPFTLIISLLLLCFSVHAQQQISNQTAQQPDVSPKQQPVPLNHTIIQLDKPYPQQLKKENNFNAKYRISIPQSKVTQLKEQKWYLFVQVETAEQFQWEKTKIQLFSINDQDNETPIKQCDSSKGLDSCFLTSSNFDYKKEKIQARVTCEEYCKFTISAQISAKYQLTPNKAVELNFENTAYSKLFSLDTNSFQSFRRLQIILKPKGFLSYNAPIKLLASKGDSIPTTQKHDYSSIHLWDDGLGIFINFPQACSKFTILVQGPQKNILTLQTKIMTQNTQIQTVRYEPYFAYIQSQETQQFKININKTQKTYIKLTTLTGSIEMSGIKDQSMKVIENQFTPLTRAYGQLQYKLQPAFFQNNKAFNISEHLYIQIKANKDSTFVFESFTNSDSMNYITPQVNRYADLGSKASDLYYLRLVQLEENLNATNKQSRIQIMTTTFQGIDLRMNVLLCKADHAKQCQPSKQDMQKLNKNETIDNDKRKQLKNIPQDNSIPGVKYLDTTIPYSQFVKKQGILRVLVIVIITNPKDQQILYTLQYIDMGKTYFLKQKQLKRDRLAIDEMKYYTFINNDQDVTQIKIHSIQISGEILMVGYNQDPRYNSVQGKQIYQYHGSVTFLSVKPGQEVFLQVQGIDNAYYSLYLQLIRQSQIRPDGNNNQGYNEIIIQQNIEYEFFIKPKEKIIFQMHATVPDFEIYIGSHLPLDLCLTQNIDKPPFAPNCQIVQTLTKNERLSIKMQKGLIGNMGVTNNNDKAVQFKVQVKTKSSQQQCTNAPLSILNTWSVPASNQTNKNSFCYKFNINRRQNLEFVVQLNNMQYQNATISWQLNDKQKQIMLNSRHIIWKKQLQKVCGTSIMNKCELIISIQSNYSTDAQAVVQFLDKDIIIIDGMAHPAFIQGQSEDHKNFRYQLMNLVNTTIIVEGKVGTYHFYGKIISRKDFYASDKSNVYPNEKEHLFKSSNPFYFLYQTYQLNETQIKNSNCTQQCVLLLSVYLQSNDLSLQEPGRFSIQVSQEDRYLKENEPTMGYLERQSLAFYEYFNPKPSTIYIQLHNQNMNCAKIFIKKGNQTRATPSAYDKMTETEGSLIIQNAQVGAYAITLQSKSMPCSYTIQVISSAVKVARIKRGVYSDKILQTNETFHFIYEHFKNESFKVLTLNKMGQLTLKLRVLEQGELNKLLSTNQSSLADYVANLTYQQSGVDYLKVHHKKSLYFCINCTYLISVTATKYTQTSLMIPSKDVQIPIIQDAMIKDQLKQKQVTKYRIFTSNIAQFQLYVQYGKINVTIVQSIANKVILSKVYEQTKEPIFEKFNSSASQLDDKGFGYDFIHYSIITIEGVANSSFYSFELLTSEDEQKHGGNVKYGIPQYFFLQPKQQKCLKGMLDDSTEQFILSFDDSAKQIVQAIKIDCKVAGVKVNYTTQSTVSQKTLQINNLTIKEPTEYQICFTSTQMVSLTFIQSAHIMMIPSDTAVLMTHSTNLTFCSKGTTVMEVDECSGRSVVSVSSSFNDLHTSESEISQIRRGNNLIEFYFWGPVFIHLQTQSSRIRWRDKDTYKQLGLGYQKFASGVALAYKQGQSIRIQAKPIQQVSNYSKKANLTITQLSYKIILAKNQKQLLGALSCYQGDVLRYDQKTISLNKTITATFAINDEMRRKFENEKYFLAGVIASLNFEVNGVIQSYRYIYPMVDIQREVLFGAEYQKAQSGGKQTPDKNPAAGSELNGTFLLVIGSIVLFIALYLVYQKWVRKWLRSRRQRLSEQGSASFKYTQFESMN